MDAFIGFICTVIGILVLALGFALGKGAAAEDCRNFGAFTNDNAAYVCHENGVSK